MNPLFILMAMQAAGMVIDYMGTKDQIRVGNLGNQVEQAGITANIAMTQAQAEDQSLQAMQNLRMTLGTQIAAFAAHGTVAGAGSAFATTQSTLKTAADDDRARRINLLANINNLQGQKVMSSINNKASATQLQAGVFKRFFNNLPVSSMFGGQGAGAGAGGSAGVPAYYSNANKGSFGMTPA